MSKELNFLLKRCLRSLSMVNFIFNSRKEKNFSDKFMCEEKCFLRIIFEKVYLNDFTRGPNISSTGMISYAFSNSYIVKIW